MDPTNPVEVAHRLSRKRAILVGLLGLALLVAQAIATQPLRAANVSWTLTAFLDLVLLATGGGLFLRTRIRTLMNDEVTRANHQTALVAGFWMAMLAALCYYWLPGVDSASAREAVRIVVTLSIAASFLVFSYLELRVHRDA
jgi:hypothetical protein